MISVIIPTYNRAQYVLDCLHGLRQCGVTEIEVIIADDGSTDDTARVVREFDPDAHYFTQPNKGTPAPGRNHGFSLSQGRYVAFLDCDDHWLPNTPARATELLDRYPQVDVLFAEARMGNSAEGYRSWIEVAGENAFWSLPCLRPEADFRIFEPTPFFRRMAERNPVFIGAAIMRREAFARSGGFDPELRGAADWELWLRMASKMTFGYLHQPLAIYTRHFDNMSSDHEGMSAEFCLALRKVREKCTWLGAAERAWIDARLRHHLFSYGYRAYDRADYGAARTRFASVLTHCGFERRAMSYWLLCSLPLGLGGAVRKAKQALTAVEEL